MILTTIPINLPRISVNEKTPAWVSRRARMVVSGSLSAACLNDFPGLGRGDVKH